ncbi:MAG: hypothetical protein N3B10_12555 [Armatimonadetes bacterium]|nr:hypothetical protein [Armatimonadota bacterium]
MKCPRCGVENADDRVYCWKCLAPLKSGAMGVRTTPQVTPSTQRPQQQIPVRPMALPHVSAPSRRFPAFIVLVPILLLIAAAVAVGVLAFLNSPQQVAQKLADAFSRGDSEAIRKLVVAKDREKLALVGFSSGQSVPTRVIGIEKSGDKVIAKLEADLSSQEGFNPQIAAAFGIPSKLELPFVLVRENYIFWRVDLEKSGPLIAESFLKSVSPQFKQLLQKAMTEAFAKMFGQAMQQKPK